jgi:hypothetical protein
MTFARLLAAVLLLCSLSAAQTSKWGTAAPNNLSGSHHLFFWDFSDTAATPSEPWRLIPKQAADASFESDPLDRIRIDQYGQPDGKHIFSSFGGPVSNLRSCSQLPAADATCHMVRAYFMSLLPNGRPASIEFPANDSDADKTCLSIRSYVVARDSKDSDSTHLVSYSTCQPTERYRLKSTEIRVESPDR